MSDEEKERREIAEMCRSFKDHPLFKDIFKRMSLTQVVEAMVKAGEVEYTSNVDIKKSIETDDVWEAKVTIRHVGQTHYD